MSKEAWIRFMRAIVCRRRKADNKRKKVVRREKKIVKLKNVIACLKEQGEIEAEEFLEV